MSIKSDRWIRQQCTPPTFVVTEMVTPPASHPMLAMTPVAKDRFVYYSEEVIKKRIRDRWASPTMIDYRRLTQEEINAFQPMISPFEPNQVKMEWRPTNEQETAWVRLHDVGVTFSTPDDWRQTGKDNESVVSAAAFEVGKKIVSYGTSSFGYDVRLADEFKIFTNINSTVIDPLNFDQRNCVDFKGDVCIIPPYSYVLGRTIERVKIPRDVMVVCLGKSTYARCGAIVNTTPIEAGFEGTVVIEISNATSLPMKVYANMGIAQFLFFQSDEECETSYADRGGKYQGQSGLQTALV